MSSQELFVLKITVTPLLVAAMTLAARRWGPTTAAVLMSLPWMTGPGLFFLSLEKGLAWAAQACIGIELGTAGIAAWVLVYLAAAKRLRWPASIAAAALTYVAAGAATGRLALSLETAAAIAAAAHVAGFLMTSPPSTPARGGALPWWDIPVRMLATALLVGVISLTADVLGPQLSGIAATYPVIMTVVATFTHRQSGVAMVILLLRSLLLSMLSFTAFFLVLGWTIEAHGPVEAFTLATLVSIACSGCILGLLRLRAQRRTE